MKALFLPSFDCLGVVCAQIINYISLSYSSNKDVKFKKSIEKKAKVN